MISNNQSPTLRLFIGSLPYRFTEGQLLELFAPFGRIVSLKIMHTPWGKSRGLGFIEYDNLDSAISAKTKLHNFIIEDRSIIVDYAKQDPALTPEGQERHRQAVVRHPAKFKSTRPSPKTDSPPPRPEYKHSFSKTPSDFEHKRQSVFDSRHHHASVGKKFASRTKKK